MTRPGTRRGLLAVALFGLAPVSLGAERTSTTQLWLDLLADWSFEQKQLLELEVGPKHLISEGEHWDELTLTPAFEYYPNPRWDLVGRVRFRTW